MGRTQVQVQQGDTLKSLAQRVYGNENLWYVLADANGLQGDDALVAGSSLTVPEVKTSSNDASTFKPYNPSEITGPTTPSLPYIAPPNAGCDVMGVVIMAVVTALVFHFAPVLAKELPAFGAAIMGTGSFAGLTIGAAATASAIVGAGASALANGIGSALGVTSFSWRKVAADGISAALSVGVGEILKGVGNAATTGATYETIKGARELTTLGRTLQGVGNYAGSVVANATVGRDTGFSWKAVAATVIGSYASAKLGGRLPEVEGGSAASNSLLSDWRDGFINGATNATARRLMGMGTQHWGAIAADSFGNALANSIVRMIQSAMDSRRLENAALSRQSADSRGSGRATLVDGQAPSGQEFPLSPMTSPLAMGAIPIAEGYGGPIYQLPDGTIVNGDSGARGSRMTADEFLRLLAEHDLMASDIEAYFPGGSPMYDRQTLNKSLNELLEIRTGLAGSTDIPLDSMGRPLYGRTELDSVDVKEPASLVGTGVGLRQGLSPPQWPDMVKDSKLRLNDYLARANQLPDKYRLPPEAKIGQLRENARAKHIERNQILDRTRAKLSQPGLNYSEGIKANGPSFDELVRKYQRLGLSERQALTRVIESKANAGQTGRAVAVNGLSIAGKGLAVVGAASDGYTLGTEINESLETGNWNNTTREASRIAGGWSGAWAGAKVFAAGGFVVGGPIGSIVGGIAGGVVGYWGGSWLGTQAHDAARR
jgi:hypothetical protein